MKDPVRQQANIAVAERLLAMMKAGDEPHDIALLFSRTLCFEIQGDHDVLPWIGHRTGREAAAGFFGISAP
jgi:hypothetical protein